jgi:TolA-binding protein
MEVAEMVKKGPSMLWALLALTFFGAGGACFADTAFELEQAEQHVEEKQYEQAEAIYRAIISADPNADAAFTAQGKLAVLYVTWGKNTEAEAALDDLLTDYSDRVGIAASVDEVADEYRQTAQYQKARQTYQYVVDQWPSARLSIALCNTLELIHAGDSAGAEQALVRMISDFARHDGLAKSVYHVADKHFRLARYEKAAQVYRYVADQWPGTKFGPESRMKAVINVSPCS